MGLQKNLHSCGLFPLYSFLLLSLLFALSALLEFVFFSLLVLLLFLFISCFVLSIFSHMVLFMFISSSSFFSVSFVIFCAVIGSSILGFSILSLFSPFLVDSSVLCMHLLIFISCISTSRMYCLIFFFFNT